jgi:hypothetical protein
VVQGALENMNADLAAEARRRFQQRYDVQVDLIVFV